MSIKGEIAGAERLVGEGQVDATLSDVKSLEIAAGGTFKGSAEVDSAVIAYLRRQQLGRLLGRETIWR